MRLFALVFLLLVTSIAALSQGSFFVEQREVNRQSCSQWMVQEVFRLYNTPSNNSLALPEVLYRRAFGNNEGEIRETITQLASLCHLYFPLLEKKLIQANLSLDYKYLPFALSGLNTSYTQPNDRSGIWAMDFPTARKWNLRVDSLVDERRGGDFTIDCAIKELKERHQKYNGNMSLVVRSFYTGNAFMGVLSRDSSLCDQGMLVRSRDFVSYFYFVKEYFPEMVSKTANALQNYFHVFSAFNPFVPSDTLSFEAMVHLLPFDLSTHRAINPVFTGEYLDPSYNKVRYLLDSKAMDRARILSDSLYRWSTPKPIKKEEVSTSEERIYHVVRRGESLGGIAKKHKVSVKNLKKWNRLKSDKIRQGQRLTIYKTIVRRKPKPELDPNTPVVDPSAVPDAIDSLQFSPPVTIIREAPKAEKPKDNYIKYKVKSGDSLWIIAKKYKVTPEQIMKWNKCGEKIRPGQVLKIYRK